MFPDLKSRFKRTMASVKPYERWEDIIPEMDPSTDVAVATFSAQTDTIVFMTKSEGKSNVILVLGVFKVSTCFKTIYYHWYYPRPVLICASLSHLESAVWREITFWDIGISCSTSGWFYSHGCHSVIQQFPLCIRLFIDLVVFWWW